MDLTSRHASHPFIWPWDPHLPAKAISSVIPKSWVPTLWNVLCPAPVTEPFIVPPFDGTLKYCHPPHKSLSLFPSPAQGDSMPSLGPCPPAHVSLGYAYTKISSLYLIWSSPHGATRRLLFILSHSNLSCFNCCYDMFYIT